MRPPRPPSYNDIARLAGVSKATAYQILCSAALAPHFTDSTIALVRSAADQLGWTSPAPPKPLLERFTRPAIGVVGIDRMPRGISIYMDLIPHLVDAAEVHGYDVIPVPLSDGLTQWRNERRAEQFSGVVLLDYMRYDLEVAARLDVPSCFFQLTYDGAIDHVYADDIQAMRLSLDHLMQFGHRKIVWLCPEPKDTFDHPSMETRRGEFFRYLQQHGLMGIPAFDLPHLMRLLQSPHPPTAIIAYNEESIPLLVSTLTDNHLVLPRDISLIAQGHGTLLTWLKPTVTSLVVPVAEIAQRCIDRLMLRIHHPAASVPYGDLVPVYLVQGSSTGPVRLLS